MPDDCILYRTYEYSIETGEAGGNDSHVVVPYCLHPKHSPFPDYKAKRGGVGVGSISKWGGSLAVCPIKDKIEDMI